MDSKLLLLPLAIGLVCCGHKAAPDVDSRPNLLFSGKYPVSNGVLSNATSHAGEYGIQLKENEICWSDVLKENGYSLGYIGKWHLDAPHEPYIECKNNRGDMKWNEWCPPERRHGFDFWYAYGTYDYHMRPLYWTTHAARDSFHFVDQWGPEHEADMAIKFIHNEGGDYRDDKKPFALGDRGVRTHQYTLYIQKYARDSAVVSLWDRKSDPYQMKNIADERPDLVERLFEQELKPWLIKTNDPWLDN